jgi:pimeloyl-ACP methyl ester carboxylesterase
VSERQRLEVEAGDGAALRGWSEGEGPTILLAHGLTAHSDLVVHGSRHLSRNGYRLLSYDARAHGESDPAGEGGYGYGQLADDLDRVADEHGSERPLLCGHSMGAHTVLALALRDPARWGGLVVIGPVSEGTAPDEGTLSYWDRLADGLEQDGVEGWLRAYSRGGFDPDWEETLLRIARERMEKHRHPDAVATALREVPRSVPFEGLEALGALDLPVLVVASRDEADPGHPHATAEQIAAALPDGELISEAEGESPLAWQGGKLSRAIETFAGSEPVRERIA